MKICKKAQRGREKPTKQYESLTYKCAQMKSVTIKNRTYIQRRQTIKLKDSGKTICTFKGTK